MKQGRRGDDNMEGSIVVRRMTADSFVEILSGMFAEPQVVVKDYGRFYAVILDEDFLAEEDQLWLKKLGFEKYPEFEESWIVTKKEIGVVISLLKELKKHGFKKVVCLSMNINDYFRIKTEVEGTIPAEGGGVEEVEL